MLDSTQGPGGGQGGDAGALSALFLSHLDRIEQIIRWIARRNRCSADEAEDFEAEAKAKLIVDGYAVFRQFDGRSRLDTYLTVVIGNLFKDYRIRRWGRFRPSAEAQRLGKVAEKLEELRWRDGLPLAEACERLLATLGEPITRAEIERIVERLPERAPRRFQSDEVLEALPAGAPLADELLLARERREDFRRAVAALQRALDELADGDRLILKMAFEDDLKIADVARALRLDQKKLYRRIDRLKRELKEKLLAWGVRWQDLGPGPPEP